MNTWHWVNPLIPDRRWPKAGQTVLVTRDWKRSPRSVEIADVVLYRGHRRFVNSPAPRDATFGYPFSNVVAWMQLPEACKT